MTMNHSEKLEKIKELFLKLKEGFNWMERHPDEAERNNALIKRAEEKIVPELEKLGVSKEFSLGILLFGPIITRKLLQQIEEGI